VVLPHQSLVLGWDCILRQKYGTRSIRPTNRTKPTCQQPNKTNFKDSYDSCLAFFRTGVQHERYWNGSHAKLQLEDVVDALTTIFPQFNLVFLFDQSLGHAKMQIDSLHMRNMNVSHGGSVGMMHDTIIQEVGPHPRKLNVGNK
jgi:hypothetical protein